MSSLLTDELRADLDAWDDEDPEVLAAIREKHGLDIDTFFVVLDEYQSEN